MERFFGSFRIPRHGQQQRQQKSSGPLVLQEEDFHDWNADYDNYTIGMKNRLKMLDEMSKDDPPPNFTNIIKWAREDAEAKKADLEKQTTKVKVIDLSDAPPPCKVLRPTLTDPSKDGPVLRRPQNQTPVYRLDKSKQNLISPIGDCGSESPAQKPLKTSSKTETLYRATADEVAETIAVSDSPERLPGRRKARKPQQTVRNPCVKSSPVYIDAFLSDDDEDIKEVAERVKTRSLTTAPATCYKECPVCKKKIHPDVNMDVHVNACLK